MYVFGSGREVLGVSGQQDWVWALPILEEHGGNGMCLCFGCGGDGGEWVGGLGQGGRVVVCLCVV